MAIKLHITDLPQQADTDQLRVLFEKYGTVSNIISTNSKAASGELYVEMADVQEAQKAMTHLNNYSYQDQKIHVRQVLLSR